MTMIFAIFQTLYCRSRLLVLGLGYSYIAALSGKVFLLARSWCSANVHEHFLEEGHIKGVPSMQRLRDIPHDPIFPLIGIGPIESGVALRSSSLYKVPGHVVLKHKMASESLPKGKKPSHMPAKSC